MPIVIFTTLSICSQNLLAQEKKVKVETPYSYVQDDSGKFVLQKIPYRESRPTWGTRFTVLSNQMVTSDKGLENATFPFEIGLSFTRNFELFSVGLEGSYLMGELDSNNEIEYGMVGGIVYLDGIFEEPYVAPYLSAGVVALFDANRNIPAVNGGGIIPKEGTVLYYKAGVLLNLSWLEKNTAYKSRVEWGLQNTYVYVGVKKIGATNGNPELSLETDPYLEYGLMLEF